MREIKFRAKRIDNGLWAYGHYVKTPISTEFEADGQFLDSGKGRHCIVQDGVAHEINIKTLGQLAEIKAENGKEIYEGDIVTAGWCWVEPHLITLPDDYYSFTEYTLDDEITVIGNIHENPELLN